jgi:SAM-dependent methyltransferase
LGSFEIGRPEPFIVAFLESASRGHPRSSIKVLDVGCGRGDRVAWLLAQGWDAYGADVQYVTQGAEFLEASGYGPNRLRTIDDYRLPFDDVAPFDIVLSYQVLEHVPDINAFVEGIREIGRPGTRGLHACPAAWRPVEPHMHAPFVHWFPKGRSRKFAIKSALKLGVGIDHFADLPLDERVEIFNEFSTMETFYRTPRALSQAFAGADQKSRLSAAAADKLNAQYRLPRPVALLSGAVYERLWACYVLTLQTVSDVNPRGGAASYKSRMADRRARGR